TGADRLVAVKVLLAREGVVEQRFSREVEALARLEHPGIVRVHRAGETSGVRWFAMELVEGAGLDCVLAEKRLAREELVKLIAQVARAVDHAHDQAIVHRDLKPANILIELPAGGAPRARVTDFGLARHLDRQTRLT